MGGTPGRGENEEDYEDMEDGEDNKGDGRHEGVERLPTPEPVLFVLTVLIVLHVLHF